MSGCRQSSGAQGVASWTMVERTGADPISLAASATFTSNTINIFTMLTSAEARVPARGCPGACGGALWLDVTCYFNTVSNAAVLALLEGVGSGTILQTDVRYLPAGDNTSALRATWRLGGPWVQLQLANLSTTTAMTADLFAVLRNG